MILLSFKRMYNSPPHLSCVSTLPKNTLATKARLFSFGLMGGCDKIVDAATNWRLRIPVFLEVLTTEWCVCILCSTHSWLKWGHQYDQILHSIRIVHGAAPCTPWIGGSEVFFSNLRRFCSIYMYRSYLKFFQQLQCRISFNQIQIFNKNTVSFIECHVYKRSNDMWKYVISAILKNWSRLHRLQCIPESK